MVRNSRLLEKEHTGLIIIDMQTKLLKAMLHKDEMMENCKKLMAGCKILKVPIFLTEQNPKGLGKTSAALKKVMGEIEPWEKTSYSCAGIEGFVRQLRTQKLDQLILTGIESHVCIWQSALDLLNTGFQVTVAQDCISSRKQEDFDIALKGMQQEGIALKSTEMILFELLKTCNDEGFKKILALIK